MPCTRDVSQYRRCKLKPPRYPKTSSVHNPCVPQKRGSVKSAAEGLMTCNMAYSLHDARSKVMVTVLISAQQSPGCQSINPQLFHLTFETLQTWAYLSHCRATITPVSKWSVLPSGGQGYFEAFVHIFLPICRNLLSIPLQMSHWKCLDFQQIGTLSDGLMKSMETCSRGSKVLRHWCPPLGRRWLQCIMVWIFVKPKNVHVAT